MFFERQRDYFPACSGSTLPLPTLLSTQLAHVKIKQMTVLNLQKEMAKTTQCWPCWLQLSVAIQRQSLSSEWLEMIASWHMPGNFSNASFGKKGEAQVGAPIVILPFSFSASNA